MHVFSVGIIFPESFDRMDTHIYFLFINYLYNLDLQRKVC